jgi:alkylhydroperoxidase family enzyme
MRYHLHEPILEADSRFGGGNMITLDANHSIGLIDPKSATAAVARAFAMLPVINVFRAMANAETLYPPYIEYLSRLFQTLELDAALERMIVLRVSKKSDCFYAWRQNVVVARSVGVTEDQISALDKDDVRAACFTAEQRIAFAFTDEVMDRVEATEETYTAARKYFSDRALTEMLYVIGTYMFVVRMVRTGRIPLDDKPAPSPQ